MRPGPSIIPPSIRQFVLNVASSAPSSTTPRCAPRPRGRVFKDDAREEKRESSRKWGEFTNKLGTLVEDLVYPSPPRVVKETLDRDTQDLMIRRKARLPDDCFRARVFDAIAVGGDLVWLNRIGCGPFALA